MSGKLFLLALACASFVQVWASSEKDEKITNAIKELNQIMFEIFWETNDFSLYSGFMLDEYNTRSEKYLKEAREESGHLYKLLENTAKFLKEEAKASNKPQSVFSCIDKVREKFSDKVEQLTTKLKSDIISERFVFAEKGQKVKVDSKTLYTGVGYEREAFENRIRSLEKIRDIDRAVQYYKTSWRSGIYVWLEKMRSDLSLQVINYDAEVGQSLLTYRSGIIFVKSQSADEMAKCLDNKQAISGKSTFLGLINMQ